MNRRLQLVLLLFPLLALSTATTQAQEVSRQFQQLDRNNDGKLTRDEFPGRLFDRIDTNQDGVISGDEDRAFSARGSDGQRRLPASVTAELDVPYADTDNPRQRLDLYLPKTRRGDDPLPLVVFIHGGAWRAGDKRGGVNTVAPLVASGDYVGASIGYRLTDEATWPAQIHDCKAAIRWLKAHADQYGLDTDRIGVIGTSAGGHLVAMLGTAGDVAQLEGDLGQHPDENSRVQAVVDLYGPTDLLAMGGSHDRPDSPESKLVGGTIQQNKEAARNASPTTYVSADDPPFLLIHGTKDPVVPFDQSELLHEALQQAGVISILVPVQDGGHGGFRSQEVSERSRKFFDKHLRDQPVTVSVEPIPGP